ncbi:ribokinase [Klugiella xanthotipulae]|uniref:Ribokinase n=1 Tax=Klugiella xanthotipulae TaxID=244735 RepID=A0A543I772_9MICO|nr:ribokinase [Klugiella xanthotipulae]TQM66405.1 ribokinase [Klugiella xanthotipulae]
MTFTQIAVIGSINVDLLLTVAELPGPGETVLGSGGEVSPGGKGANQAVAAARQGASVRVLGAVGGDANAGVALSLLADAGVDLTHIARLDGPTGLAVVSVDGHAENSIIVVPGANALVTPAHVDAALPDLIECVIAVFQGELPVDTLDHASAVLPGDVRQILNLAPVVNVALDTLRRADPLIVNEGEAADVLRMLGHELPHPVLSSPLSSPLDTGRLRAEALVNAGCRSAVVTLGAVVRDRGVTTGIPSTPAVSVDSTGAGDAFVGTVAAGLAAGLTLVEACGQASAVAAVSVQSPGAQTSYPWAVR